MATVTASLALVLVGFQVAVAFEWTGTSNGSTVQACLGESVSLNFSFLTGSSERVDSIEWRHVTNGVDSIMAALVSGHFLTSPTHSTLHFLPSAGIHIPSANWTHFGAYHVRVNYLLDGTHHSATQTAVLTFPDAPVLHKGRLAVHVQHQPVVDTSTGQSHVQLACGTFLTQGSRSVTVTWKTPAGVTMDSTSYSNGLFLLNLPNPVQGGVYTCHIDDPSSMAACMRDVSRLKQGAFVEVDEVQARLMLVEKESKQLRYVAQDIRADLEQQDSVMADLTEKGVTLTSQVAELHQTNDELRSSMSELTSENTKLREDLVKQMTSINELKTSMEQLTETSSKSVSFHVRLHTDTTVPDEGVLILGNVVTNNGNAYSTSTGKFTAPYTGTYFFIATVSVDSTGNANMFIVVDGHVAAECRLKYISDNELSTCQAVVSLAEGQLVWIRSNGVGSFDSGDTSFSGFLVAPR